MADLQARSNESFYRHIKTSLIIGINNRLIGSLPCLFCFKVAFGGTPRDGDVALKESRSDYYLNQRYQQRQGKTGKERWKDICRTINADPYASPGRSPYPAAPVCPW
ncbi:hypothetical protein HZH66_012735 [Vespula vulgaris]|uniref:Uncharacterized protein n=1 Tax=Vespula vulgaris TaxID=7454 RepID=A0A834MSB4_VESVU|nr:hypothetical protein HZH66_012735 [Vespula vulgaris]